MYLYVYTNILSTNHTPVWPGLLLEPQHVELSEFGVRSEMSASLIMQTGTEMAITYGAEINTPPKLYWPGLPSLLDFRALLDDLDATGYAGFVSGEFMPLPDADTAAKNAVDYLRALEK